MAITSQQPRYAGPRQAGDRSEALDSKRTQVATLAAMSLGYGVVQLDVTIVNVALNSIGTTFGGSVAGLQWVVSAYTVAFAALILIAGGLGDRIGANPAK